MSYGMGLAPPPPGSSLGPDHPVPPIETHFPQKIMLTWGAWPSDGSGYNPMYLAAPSPTGGSLPTISTSDALISLKYQVAIAGAAGLVIGWLLRGGPKAVSANRRRMRRNGGRPAPRFRVGSRVTVPAVKSGVFTVKERRWDSKSGRWDYFVGASLGGQATGYWEDEHGLKKAPTHRKYARRSHR